MTAIEAGERCKVRGYIAQNNQPPHIYKNTVGFYQCLPNLPGNDWECFDPEADDNPLTA